MAGIAGRVRKGSLWVGGARLIVSALGLVSTIVLARLLTPGDFGVVAIGTTILLISNALTELSLTNALIHHEEPEKRHLDCAWTLNFLRGMVLAAILFVIAPYVASFYEDERLEFVVQIIALSAFLTGLLNPKLALLKRDLQFWQDFALQTSQKLAMVIVSIAMAIIFKSYLALLGGIVAGQFVALVVSYIFVPHRPSFRLKETREFLGFSGWLVFDQILQTLIWRVDPLIIGKFLGSAQLGLFTLSMTVSNMPTRDTVSALGATLFPAFRQIRDAPARLRAAYLRAQTLMTAIALPAGVLMSALAEPLVFVALGEKWSGAAPIIEILAVMVALQSIGSSARPLAMAKGMTKLLFQRSLIAAIYRLPIIIGALMLGGLETLLYGLIVIYLLGLILNIHVASKAAGIGFLDHWNANWRTLAAVSLAFVAARGFLNMMGPSTDWLAGLGSVAFAGAAGGFTYIAVLFVLWILTGRKQGAEVELLGQLSDVGRRFGFDLPWSSRQGGPLN